jgi:hypothetical protein
MIFFNYLDLKLNATIHERCKYFENKRMNDPSWSLIA